MRMNLAPLAVCVVLAAAAPAAATPESVWSSGESFLGSVRAGLPDVRILKSRAPADFASRRAAGGTITGAMNHSPVQLQFDRRAWTITGGINNSPVQVAIDHAARRIHGGANHSPVELAFEWTSDRWCIEGGANRSPVRLETYWLRGTLEGHSNRSPVKLEFDLPAGTIRGYANRAPVELSYDAASGRITGAMNRSPVDITLVNLDLSDFLSHLYLFLRP